MTTPTELAAKITKLPTNLDRYDGIINGPASGPNSIVGVDSGPVKTVARVLAEAAADAGERLLVDGSNATPDLRTNLGLSVSVEDFGAQAGNSAFDSTAAIHTAIATVSALGGGRVLFPSAGNYYANVDLVGSNITLEWPAGATVGTHALRPFDGTKAPLTIGGSDTTITRDCALINPCISGVKIGGNYALAADNAPAALDIKGNTAILHVQNPHIYNGVKTINLIPSATKEVVSVKFFGGEVRNDITDSTSARTIYGEYVNTLGYYNDVIFFGTKVNGPQQGAVVHMAGGALFEGHGCYVDMYPGATFKFTTGGTALFHGCNLDPHGIDEIIVVTDDLTTDPNRVWQGDIRHGPQKWQNGLGTVFDIPDEANNVYYRAALRDSWLNDAIYFGRSTNRYSTTEGMIPRSDTGPMDLFGMDWSVRNTTQATDLDTAALQTKGGLSVTKDARIGGAIEVYGGNAISAGQISASTAEGGLFIASNVPGQDVQLVPGGGAYLRVRGGAGIRTHDDNVQANGITGNAWAFTTSYEYRDGAGNKLLGARGAAVANATDAASAITQLNALLSRLRAHGLIAT